MTSDRRPIRALDNDLINKIAAGEVVERPASVVKELVENALDAGARHIVVAIKDGGRKLIRVTDDGVGIPPDELELAVARHATSKILEFDDLYRLATRGFRGEALASIASVSQLTLSSQSQNHEAVEIVVHGGNIADKRACAHPQGTSVEAKYLFYQTPARLKFLRSKETESSHVADVIHKMALSRPDVAFKFLNEDRDVFDAPANETPQRRATRILGDDFAAFIYPFHGDAPGMSVSGFFGHPQIARSQRSHAFFFVNSRAVNDKTLWHAAMESYRDLLMKGKFPVLVLDLKIDEATVDVNVHPQKSEIRFHHGQQVHAFVKDILRKHLREQPWMAQATTDNAAPASSEDSFSHAEAQSAPVTAKEWPQKDRVREVMAPWGDAYFANPSPETNWAPKPFAGSQEFSAASPQITRAGDQNEFRFGKTPYAAMQPIGQLFGTYILCETPGKLVLVDQHAAHERVGFEKLMLAFKERGIAREPLLVPETFDLNPSDAAILQNYLSELEAFGFEIEHFGGNTFVVKALPGIFKNKQGLPALVADVIADVKETGELVALKDKLHHVFATMACHGQIRAHHRLTHDEMSALLKELDAYQFTDFCPHGRPVCVEITEGEIQKWFRRIL